MRSRESGFVPQESWEFFLDELQMWRWARHSLEQRNIESSRESFSSSTDCAADAKKAGFRWQSRPLDKMVARDGTEGRSSVAPCAEPTDTCGAEPSQMLLNRHRLFDRLSRHGYDAIIATGPENVTYSSGFWSLSQWIRRGPQVYVLWPAEKLGEPAIVAGSSVLDLLADQQLWVDEVWRYGFFSINRSEQEEHDRADQRILELLKRPELETSVEALVELLRDRDLIGGKIGLDESGLSPVTVDELRYALPTTTFCFAADVLRDVRTIKTADEIDRLRFAAQMTERSIDAALEIAREGVTEQELAVAFHQTTIREGGMPVLGCIGTGPRSALGNVQPSGRSLRMGDVIRFDAGGRYRHYRADIARIATLGEPSPKVEAYYRALRLGIDRAYEMIRPGIAVKDVFESVVDVVRREGIAHYERSHVGHGIGLDGYDPPLLSPNSEAVIEEGMTLCVETPYYELGFAGLQVEDMIVVRSDGVESLMSTGRELRII